MGVEGPEATLPPLPAATGSGLACGGAGRDPRGVARGTGWESSRAGVGSQPRMEKVFAGGCMELPGLCVGAVAVGTACVR